jgi:hypothetical protein
MNIALKFKKIKDDLKNGPAGVAETWGILFDYQKLDEFCNFLYEVELGVPCDKKEFKSKVKIFNEYLVSYKLKIKNYLKDNKGSHAQKIINDYNSILNEFNAIIKMLETDFLKVALDTLTVDGHKVYVVDKDKSIASFIHYQGLVITISLVVPKKLRIPVAMHEIAEGNYKGKGNAHKLAGVPAGRKKAAELGVLEEFLEFEKKVANGF